uniref:Uncharacterized protein n=1 Tax=Marseillevirus LCMAC101 TaxID=2506602 RepID=A0A481YU44_9VIRU|nr:MAG: hypothetical protein LCMAC101_06390 [Marseillevirus LCMAC101]
MTEIGPKVNIENIRQVSKDAQGRLNREEQENTDKLLKKVLDHISIKARSGSSSHISVGLHDIHHKEIYPLADREEVLKILKDRGFEASIGRAHPAFPDCDCRGEPCMDWLRVENTWSCCD